MALGSSLKVTSMTAMRLADADLRGGQADAVGGVHGLEHVFDELLQVLVEDRNRFRRAFREPDCRILRWDRSSVIFQLLAVSLEVAQGLGHGVAAELFESAAGQGESDHGFGRDSGGGHDTDVGTFVGGFDRLAAWKNRRTAAGGAR